MSENVFERYEHHGKLVWVRADKKGQHRKYCLCWQCQNFIPNSDGMGIFWENCPIAQELYELCVKHGLTTPVFECPRFCELVRTPGDES